MDNAIILMFTFTIISMSLTFLLLDNFRRQLNIESEKTREILLAKNDILKARQDVVGTVRVMTDGVADIRQDIFNLKSTVSQLTDRVDSLESLIDLKSPTP